MRFVAGQGDEAAAQHHGRHVGLDHQAAAEGLHDHGDIEERAAEPPVRLGQRHGKPAEPSERRPVFAAETEFAGGQLLARREGIIALDEALGTLLEQLLLVGQGKIHQSPSTILAMMFFWISLEPP